jgi:hypothetical protein
MTKTRDRDWWEKIHVNAEGKLEVVDGWWTRPENCKAYLERFHVLAIECLELTEFDNGDDVFYQKELEALMKHVEGVVNGTLARTLSRHDYPTLTPYDAPKEGEIA